jgi:hypothetical protein
MAEQELLHQIDAKLAAARRRQMLQLWLDALPTCLALLLLAATAWYLAAPWLALLKLDPWLTAGSALALSLVASIAWSLWRRPSRAAAALAVDRAFNLRERITTIVSLRPDQRSSPAGHALLAETRKHVEALNVPERFPIHLPRREIAAPLGGLLAMILASFFALGPRPATPVVPPKEEVKQQLPPFNLEALRKENEERKQRLKDLDSEQLAELAQEFDKLLSQADKPMDQKELQLKIQELTRLNEQLKKRQEELAKSVDMKRQLRNDPALKNPEEGPAKALQQALSQGDMKKAEEELKKLMEKLQKDALKPEEKEQLQKQLKELSQKLGAVAQQKQRLENLAKSNADPETKQREMDQIQKDIAQMKDLEEMADKLAKAQQALKDGRRDEALAALKELAEDLKGEELSAEELAELQKLEIDLEELQEGFG